MQPNGVTDISADMLSLQSELAMLSASDEKDSALAKRAANRLNLLESMLETVPVGVVLADAQGKIVHGNKAVVEMVRHPVLYSEDANSYGEWISFHADGRQVESSEYPLYRVLIDGEEDSRLDVHYQRGDGTRFWMQIIGKPVRGSDGELIGATVALVDIDEFRRLQGMQEILIAELNHRVKNAFTVMKSIVAQSLRGAGAPDGLRATLDDRLNAYASAHSRLVGNQWTQADLMDLSKEIVLRIDSERVTIDGPQVSVPTRQALAFSMAFYELTSNAVKYGALSVPEGRVTLRWNLTDEGEDQRLHVIWQEQGGPICSEPTAKGFGSFITGRALSAETGGQVIANFNPDGLLWTLEMPTNELNIETKIDRCPPTDLHC